MAGWIASRPHLETIPRQAYGKLMLKRHQFFVMVIRMDTIFITIFCWLCILPFFIVLFFGAVIGILYLDRRKHTQAWRELATRSGLTFNAPSWFLARPTLTGNWHGRPVRIYTRSSGTSRTGANTFMYIEMAANLPEGTQLSLLERDLFHQPRPDDIRSGDAEFDQRFIVRGQPPESLHRLLMDGGLRRLLLHAHYLRLETIAGALRYRKLNIETNTEAMMSLISLLFDVADALERA